MYDYQFPDAARTAWLLVSQTWSAMHKVAERDLAKVNLTLERLQILYACRDHSSPLIPAEISRMLFLESQSIAGLLDRMDRDGLVKRVPKRKGHPFTEVQITAKGEELLNSGIEVAMGSIAKVMYSLSAEELIQLQEPLREMRQNALEALYLELSPAPDNALFLGKYEEA